MKRYVILVSGKVQGVFFRASTKEEAERLGLTGFVKNQADGSVYIEAEGSEAKLNQLLMWCRQGPSRAVVSTVDWKELPLQHFTSFQVKR